jgi:lambda family phage portal protein
VDKLPQPWATFVTVLDPDRIETPPEKVGRDDVFEGKRLDPHGRMLGMWVRRGHPGEGWDGRSFDYEYVPRETWWGRAMAWHWFAKTRGQQQRGLTPLITIIRQSTMLSQFDDAQLGAAVISAVLATYIKTKSSPETIAEQLAPPKKDGTTSFFDQKADYYSKAKMRVGGQRIPLMAPDDEIVMAAIARAIADPTAFRTGFMREFGMALGLGQGQIANSFADFNYSSARAELLEVFRGVLRKRRQHNAHVASPIYGAVIEEAIEIGALVLPSGWPPFQENRAAYTSAEWTGPGMGNLDPLKEANAMLVRLQSKTSSRKREAAANGDDYLDIFDEIEDEEDEADARGFDLEVKQSAAGLPSDGGPEDTGNTPKKKPGKVQGDGDGDGIPNENEQ